MKKIKNYIKKNWLPFVLGFLIGCWLTITITIFRADQQLANAYVAVGTLTLAIVTGFLAYFTYLSVKGGYDREKRNIKVKLITEIREWANNGLHFVTRMTRLPTTHEHFPKVYEAISFFTYTKGYRYFIADSSKLLNNTELTNSLEKAFESVVECLKSFKGTGKGNRLGCATKCEHAFTEVLERISNISSD